MLNRVFAAAIAIAVIAVITAGMAAMPASIANLSFFDIVAFATFTFTAAAKVIAPALLFAVTGDAE